MNVVVDGLGQLGTASLRLLTQPFYYIAVLFVLLQYRKQIQLQRKLFHVKLNSLLPLMLKTVFFGLLAGVGGSAVMLVLGAALNLETLILLWGFSLFFVLFQFRYLCFAYAAGVVSLLHAIVEFVPEPADTPVITWLYDALMSVHVPSLLAIVAVLHLIEALLIRTQGLQAATPLFLEGKRGKVVGGYSIQGFWPVPLLIPIPSAEGFEAAWTPLLGGDVWGAGMGFLAFPVMIGFAELTKTQLPKQKVRHTTQWLIGYGTVLLAAAIASEFVTPLVFAAAVISVLLHEYIIWNSRMYESNRVPLYLHDNRGLRILGVIPGSPAEDLGIQTGEIISRVNGVKVLNKEQLHKALRLNSAYVKLEIVNTDGELKFLKRAVFSGEHHQLGILLAPDEYADVYVGHKQKQIWTFRSKGRTSSPPPQATTTADR